MTRYECEVDLYLDDSINVEVDALNEGAAKMKAEGKTKRYESELADFVRVWTKECYPI